MAHVWEMTEVWRRHIEKKTLRFRVDPTHRCWDETPSRITLFYPDIRLYGCLGCGRYHLCNTPGAVGAPSGAMQCVAHETDSNICCAISGLEIGRLAATLGNYDDEHHMYLEGYFSGRDDRARMERIAGNVRKRPTRIGRTRFGDTTAKRIETTLRRDPLYYKEILHATTAAPRWQSAAQAGAPRRWDSADAARRPAITTIPPRPASAPPGTSAGGGDAMDIDEEDDAAAATAAATEGQVVTGDIPHDEDAEIELDAVLVRAASAIAVFDGAAEQAYWDTHFAYLEFHQAAFTMAPVCIHHVSHANVGVGTVDLRALTVQHRRDRDYASAAAAAHVLPSHRTDRQVGVYVSYIIGTLVVTARAISAEYKQEALEYQQAIYAAAGGPPPADEQAVLDGIVAQTKELVGLSNIDVTAYTARYVTRVRRLLALLTRIKAARGASGSTLGPEKLSAAYLLQCAHLPFVVTDSGGYHAHLWGPDPWLASLKRYGCADRFVLKCQVGHNRYLGSGQKNERANVASMLTDGVGLVTYAQRNITTWGKEIRGTLATSGLSGMAMRHAMRIPLSKQKIKSPLV